MDLVIDTYYRLEIPWKHANPKAYIYQVFKNAYIDIYDKQVKEQNRKTDKMQVSDESDEIHDLIDTLSGDEPNPEQQLELKQEYQSVVSLLTSFEKRGK